MLNVDMKLISKTSPGRSKHVYPQIKQKRKKTDLLDRK